MDTDVVVVGAGAAGLAAALWLAQRSVRVAVLDGRDRIGGRVLSQPVGTVEVPAELGAEFIHGAAPETTAFLREAGLTNVETGDVAWACGSDGILRPYTDDGDTENIFERVRSFAHDQSVEAFLRQFDDDPQMRERARRARSFVEGFEAADPALASARSIADEIHTGIDETSSRPVGSYAPLFAHLGERCVRAGVDVRLGTTVERIAWANRAATIDARHEQNGPLTWRSRCTVITVPVGVLRQRGDAVPLSFVPALPERKLAALRGLEMGHAVRVVLAFRSPFWERIAEGRYRDAAFFRCDDGAFNAFWTQLPLRGRTIVAWAGGPRATAMDGMAADARIESALDRFGAMLGERDLARREFEGGITHDWSADPLACGAYSYVLTGARDARATLGTPLDQTLFFAGEATSIDGQGGTVSGAFETGTRAAREAFEALDRAGETAQIVP